MPRMRWVLLLCIITGLWSQAQAATVLETAAATMAPGTFVTLTTVGLTRELTEPCMDSSNIFEYADSAAWDPIRRTWNFVGETHGTCLQGDWIIYDDATNTWSIGPTPIPCMQISSGCPNARHQWDHYSMDYTTGDQYYRHLNNAVLRYTAVTNTWDQLPYLPPPLTPGDDSSCCVPTSYFPERAGLYLFDSRNGIWFWTKATNTWELVANTTLILDPGKPIINDIRGDMLAEYNPITHEIMFGGGDLSKSAYKIDTSGTITKLNDFPSDLLGQVLILYNHLTWDPASGRFLLFYATGSIYEYNSPTDTWTLMPYTHPFKIPGPTEALAEIMGGMGAVPTYGVLMYFKWTSAGGSQIWLYKHQAGVLDTLRPKPPTNLLVVP
jgi:hypothetical protein